QPNAEFEDIGVGGSEKFNVSEPLFLSLAPYSSNSDGSNAGEYSKPAGPVRVELRPSTGWMEMLTGGLDVAGMPAMAGKVEVIDARPQNTLIDKLHTSVAAPTDTTIPKATRHVPLTYVHFNRFTKSAGPAPALAPSPMIGPNPFKQGDTARPVIVKFNG